MASKLSTVATFLTGMVLGAGMVYLAPPAGPGDGQGGMGGPPGDGGPMGGPPGQGGEPPGGVPGVHPGAPPDGAGLPGADVVPPPGGGNPTTGPDGQQLPSPTDALFPPPPTGAGPPDGAAGPPLSADGQPTAEASPTSVARTEQGPTTKGGRQPDWLERHLEGGADFWTKAARKAEQSGDPTLSGFASRMKAVAAKAPKVGDRPPPLPEVVVWLHSELELYDDMEAAGLDVAAVQTELDELLKVR